MSDKRKMSKDTMKPLPGFSTIQFEYKAGPQVRQQEACLGWSIKVVCTDAGQGHYGSFNVVLTKSEDIDPGTGFLECSVRSFEHRKSDWREVFHTDTLFFWFCPTLSPVQINFTAQGRGQLCDPQTDDTMPATGHGTIPDGVSEFLFCARRISPSPVPPTVPVDAMKAKLLLIVAPQLVRAIESATSSGVWGDVCFVVNNHEGDSAVALVHADLETLRSQGAEGWAKRIEEAAQPTLDAAIQLLFKQVSHLRQKPVTTPKVPPELAGQSSPARELRHYVPCPFISITTLKAVLVYVSTGRIGFSRINSANDDPSNTQKDGRQGDVEFDDIGDTTSRTEALDLDSDDEDQANMDKVLWTATPSIGTSPRSVYRAARRFGLVDLQKLAMKALDEQITPSNILYELFDSFTLKYPKIAAKRLAYAKAQWNGMTADQKMKLGEIYQKNAHRRGVSEMFNAFIASTVVAQPIRRP